MLAVRHRLHISECHDSRTPTDSLSCGLHAQATVFMSLLQPAPEIFSLFDDVCLISEGRIVFMGRREEVRDGGKNLGFLQLIWVC